MNMSGRNNKIRESKNTKTKVELLQEIQDEVTTLECALANERRKNGVLPVLGEGNHDAKIMFVGEAPGKNEALKGMPFCGASGKFLDVLLESIDLDRKTVYITNLVKDRPTDNRDPYPEEIESYGEFLKRQIQIIKPEVIVTLGRLSMKYIFEYVGLTAELLPISKIHGKTFKKNIKALNISQTEATPESVIEKSREVTVIAMYHPAVALYKGTNRKVLLEDFQNIKNLLVLPVLMKKISKTNKVPVPELKAESKKAEKKIKKMTEDQINTKDQTKMKEKKILVKEKWDFSNLYSSITDPKIETDLKKIEQTYASFAKKYSATPFTKNSKTLKTALDDWSKLLTITATAKPVWYLHLLAEVDGENEKIGPLFTTANQRVINASNKILFFNLELGKIAPTQQKKYLAEKVLLPYKAYLVSIFETARFNLSEKEEKILSIKSTPSYTMWVQAQKKHMTSQMVKHNGKMIPLTEAQAIKSNLPVKERHALHKEISKKWKEISFFAEAELNAVISNKQSTDDLRGLKKSYEATVLGYQNSIASVENLVSVVTKRFDDPKRFYKIKAKALGLKKLTLADVYAPIGKSSKKYTLEEGVQIVREAFGAVKPEFADMFVQFMLDGRFDIYPRKGKRNGAFCSGGPGVPTYVMLNHTDDAGSISTMAHEMGHAIHTELSKNQPVLYEDYTISVAEVASTFFENVLFDYMYNLANEKERKILLLEKIQDDVSTIYAQISFFNYEVDLHKGIREKGMMSGEEMASLMIDHRKRFMGDSFEYTEEDGYFFTIFSHLRYFFYVYAYAYGQLIANSLYAEYKKDPAFLDKIIYFLSAGSSKKPDDIFKDIGIDVTKPDFFEKGLIQISENIQKAEEMWMK